MCRAAEKHPRKQNKTKNLTKKRRKKKKKKDKFVQDGQQQSRGKKKKEALAVKSLDFFLWQIPAFQISEVTCNFLLFGNTM